MPALKGRLERTHIDFFTTAWRPILLRYSWVLHVLSYAFAGTSALVIVASVFAGNPQANDPVHYAYPIAAAALAGVAIAYFIFVKLLILKPQDIKEGAATRFLSIDCIDHLSMGQDGHRIAIAKAERVLGVPRVLVWRTQKGGLLERFSDRFLEVLDVALLYAK